MSDWKTLAAILVPLTVGCTVHPRASVDPGVATYRCDSKASREIRRVGRSAAFRQAADARVPGDTAYRNWLCSELRLTTFRSFFGLQFVNTWAIQSIENHDMVFASVGGRPMLMNPWVLETGAELIDTTAWNGLIRGRISRPLNGTIEITTLGCVLTLVAAGEMGGDGCWSPPPISISSNGEILTLTGTPANRYPEYQFRVRLDGTLAEIPRFPPRQ